ncbi:class I SAM-dependent methyltransferase [Aerosakkonemataceae cyanobacterium BLCC-F50]|uniref:Class I SAM-dependent methyltransferase n=1 Tax=Floridaenema flaviceps BLCC-F50 TaxID=3153642 RepID=A0ABV4Y2J2_9CYAN
MDEQEYDSIERTRQQFDAAPYPRIPLDQYPNDRKYLSIYNLVTSYYLRNQRLIETEGKVILDAGCGSGFISLALAVANPGAKVVGIDLSEQSVNLAKKRLNYHGFKNVEFYPLSIYDLPKLGREFDYINCDDTLYLLPDAIAGLEAMKSVLKPEGIIRANLHNYRTRFQFLTSQKLFKLMGLMDGTPGDSEIEQVRATMNALKDDVLLKVNTWKTQYENNPEWYLANYLLQGDRGYTIPEMFAALKAADLEFISMVNWHQWNLLDLFKEPNNLPALIGISLPELSIEEQLYIYELLHPIHRLLDFWCGHPNVAPTPVPVAQWTDSDWQKVVVHLHPSQRVPEVKKEILDGLKDNKQLEIGRFIPFLKGNTLLMDSTVGACILPLFEGSQPMKSLVQRWLQYRPVDPVTLKPTEERKAFEILKQMLTNLEPLAFVLLERPQ